VSQISVVSLPHEPNADPNRPRVDDALEVVADAMPLTASDKLTRMAGASGDISHIFPPEKLAEIGETVVVNYERDKRDRKEWEEVAEEALEAAAQSETGKAKDFPWANASNMKWPVLTIACMQFNARMLPAVVKGDEAVNCKVIGQDNGKPKMGQNPQSGEIQPVPLMGQDGQPALDPSGMPQMDWIVPPGGKAKRARRVADYLNTTLFYRMENWEDDTDALLMQLPAVGCVFRKNWVDANGQPQTATVSALNLVVPQKARNLDTALRITERIEDVYPYEIRERMRSGFYRDAPAALGVQPMPGQENAASEPNDGARLLLEQHCLWDFDEDGIEEPYIVTVDHQTRVVLRIEPSFGPDDIKWRDDETPIGIRRRKFYTKYSMFPHPAGRFYDIGLGHLLRKLGASIDTLINQLLDAGTAQTAGGGFIGSGVRLQSRGNRGRVVFAPGEYKTVDVPGDQLRNAIVERTLPNVSPVTFQLLELILGASRDIAGIKDVVTGEASNQGQVGTTLALIDQGLQVFNSCAKRTFRALKSDYGLLFENIGLYGGDAMAADYAETLDDPEADFAKDFASDDLDIRPVSDPASVTRMQKMARAQFLLSLLPQIMTLGGNGEEVMRRVLEATDTEDIEKLFPPKPPADPRMAEAQMQQLIENLRLLSASADEKEASATAKNAKAMLDVLEAQAKKLEVTHTAGQMGMALGAAAAHTNGGMPQ
jgi:chaperonin GroES